MKLETIRVRRTRPSAPALALALALTMLCVYLLSLSSMPEVDPGDAASAGVAGEAEIRMEGLTVAFACDARCDDMTTARIEAAKCASNGGAGLVLGDDGQFAVVREALDPSDAPENALRRSASGLTLRVSGPASEISALSEAVNFLRAQATETGDFANEVESREGSVTALLEVYRTQGARAVASMEPISEENSVAQSLREATQTVLNCLNEALQAPTPAKLRLLHATACCQWLDLLQKFTGEF